jgi:tripartite-type tricarboxylate transporter receptor subunit TctC
MSHTITVTPRVTAERLRTFLGQPIIIETVGGAGGSIGAGRVARAAPDGYTLGIGKWSTHVGNGAIYTLPYDVLNDFAPVALLIELSLIIVARKTLPANDLKELVAWLKANPDRASAGTTAWVVVVTLRASSSRTSRPPAFSTCLIAGMRPLYRIWSQAKSI